MPRKSNKTQEVLSFLQEFMVEKGYGPSVREICQGVNLKSSATVHYHLKKLQESGAIAMDACKNRTITLQNIEESLPRFPSIPLIGVVTAGVPILAVEQVEGYIPWDGDDGCFALRVRGDSMINAGILSGDLVVVHPQNTANHGDIVVALLDDEATVKRLCLGENRVWLMPENENFSPIDGTEATILGKVQGLTRKL
ncbi:MAG: transcriptional repressor LexA [Eubacteriales bacterium]